MTLGERIKEARKRKGLTQEELSYVTEISISAITKYETNLREAKVEMLVKIAEALKIPIESLIYDDCIPIEENIPLSKYSTKELLQELLRRECEDNE